MTRRLAALIAGLSALAVTAGPLASGAGAHARRAPVTNLLVDAQEWSLWPSRTTLPAGTIDVELWNRGEDMHDLRIRHVNSHGDMYGPIDGAVKVTPSGAISHAVWHLTAGHYMLYCSMPGHYQLGMHTRITIS